MKKINQKFTGIATILLSTAILFSGCGLNKMIKNYEEAVTYTPSINPLENHGGSVAVEVQGRIADGYYHTKAIAEITPVLKHGDSETSLNTVILRGENTESGGILISRGGGTFNISDKVDFSEELLASELYLKVRIYPEGREDNDAILPERKVADGVINTSQRVEKDERLTIAPHGYEKEVIVKKSANVYFEYMKHNLNWRLDLNQEEENKEKVDAMNEFLKKGWEVKSVKINAWASPEGEVAYNEELSEKRAATGENYWKGQFQRVARDIDEYEVPEIEVSAGGEDFDGFMQKLRASDIPQKDAIANVINSELSPIEREQRIKDMTVIYEDIEKILKPLRRAEIIVEAYEPKRTDEEIATLSTTEPEVLDAKELLYAGTLTEDLETKLQIYNAAKELHPQNYAGFNNAGYANLKLGNVEAAAQDLEKANELAPNTAYVLNNLGAIAAWEGDYENAKSYYDEAKGRIREPNYNLGNIMILVGDYPAALSSYAGQRCTHNISLAHLMNNNDTAAMSNLECSEESAAVAYLTAIIGARRDNNTMAFENLRKAIELDPSYKEQAQIDREFIKLFNVAEFQDIVE